MGQAGVSGREKGSEAGHGYREEAGRPGSATDSKATLATLVGKLLEQEEEEAEARQMEASPLRTRGPSHGQQRTKVTELGSGSSRSEVMSHSQGPWRIELRQPAAELGRMLTTSFLS